MNTHPSSFYYSSRWESLSAKVLIQSALQAAVDVLPLWGAPKEVKDFLSGEISLYTEAASAASTIEHRHPWGTPERYAAEAASWAASMVSSARSMWVNNVMDITDKKLVDDVIQSTGQNWIDQITGPAGSVGYSFVRACIETHRASMQAVAEKDAKELERKQTDPKTVFDAKWQRCEKEVAKQTLRLSLADEKNEVETKGEYRVELREPRSQLVHFVARGSVQEISTQVHNRVPVHLAFSWGEIFRAVSAAVKDGSARIGSSFEIGNGRLDYVLVSVKG